MEIRTGSTDGTVALTLLDESESGLDVGLVASKEQSTFVFSGTFSVFLLSDFWAESYSTPRDLTVVKLVVSQSGSVRPWIGPTNVCRPRAFMHIAEFIREREVVVPGLHESFSVN